MIAVIADDFSGAAELAAAAAGAGLTAELHLEPLPFGPETQLVAYTSESRSLPNEAASSAAGILATRISELRPDWVYKKTDSVLRGSVAAEITAIAQALVKSRALLIPANPGKGRVIVAGRYSIHGVPLQETPFAVDPEHPRTTSVVTELLGESGVPIITPDAASPEDLSRHASALVWSDILPAGGVEFFEACLRTRGLLAKPPSPAALPDLGRRLLICGSHAAWQADRASTCRALGIPFATLGESTGGLAAHNRAMLAIGESQGSPEELLGSLIASASPELLQAFDTILLEGGATAHAVIAAQGWKQFRALPSPTGVAILEVAGSAGPRLVVKPGSYPWPDSVWP